MKTKLMLAAQALLMTSGAHAQTPPEEYGPEGRLSAMVRMTSASFAGSNNRCPRFKYMEGTMGLEMREYGLDKIPESEVKSMHQSAFAVVFLAYEEDQSAFCSAAWNMLGPNGTYKRQMLEAK